MSFQHVMFMSGGKNLSLYPIHDSYENLSTKLKYGLELIGFYNKLDEILVPAKAVCEVENQLTLFFFLVKGELKIVL